MAESFPKDMFEDLKEQVPKTRVGFVQHFLPRIEESLASGHSVKDVWEYARGHGFNVSYYDFCRYLRQVRARVRKTRARSSARANAQSAEKAVDLRQSTSSEAVQHDPFANLRRAEAERTVFNYRGTRDLEELVYGKRKHNQEQ